MLYRYVFFNLINKLMKTFNILFIIAPLIFLFTSCTSTMVVGSDYDKSINFNKFKSYAWIPQPDVVYKDKRYNNQIIENNIKYYADSAMKNIGFVIDTIDPDIILSYDLQIEKGERTEEVPIYSHPNNFNMFWGNPINPIMHQFNPSLNPNSPLIMDRWFNPFGFNDRFMFNNFWTPPPPMIVGYNTKQIPFKEGTVTISILDRSNNRLAWRGWSVSCIMDPYNFKENLETKIHAIFKRFPR